jgi:hypothetical protein
LHIYLFFVFGDLLSRRRTLRYALKIERTQMLGYQRMWGHNM